MMIEPIAIRPRMLMGPGPSDVNPKVLGALAQPTIGHSWMGSFWWC